MNILMIAKVDHAGSGFSIMQAINRTQLVEPHTARLVTFRKSKFDYPLDVHRPSHFELAHLVHWANVINIHDEGSGFLQKFMPLRKPVIATYHGTWYRQNHNDINRDAMRRGIRQTCITVDLCAYGPEWIGPAMSPISNIKEHEDQKPFVVCHSPSSRARKGTARVIEVARSLGLELNLIENMTNVECLKRKAYGSVFIDQVGERGLGYGTSALEAWALGYPVISSAPPQVIHLMSLHYKIPFINCTTVKEMQAALVRLRDDPEYYKEWAIAGRNHLLTYHSPRYVAERFIEICRKAMR